MKKRQIGLLAALSVMAGTVLAQQAPQQAPQKDFPEIINFLRVDKQICTGGQPSLEDLARLKAEGVRAIINLRQPAAEGRTGR